MQQGFRSLKKQLTISVCLASEAPLSLPHSRAIRSILHIERCLDSRRSLDMTTVILSKMTKTDVHTVILSKMTKTDVHIVILSGA